jgi:hypothetical protein
MWLPIAAKTCFVRLAFAGFAACQSEARCVPGVGPSQPTHAQDRHAATHAVGGAAVAAARKMLASDNEYLDSISTYMLKPAPCRPASTVRWTARSRRLRIWHWSGFACSRSLRGISINFIGFFGFLLGFCSPSDGEWR